MMQGNGSKARAMRGSLGSMRIAASPTTIVKSLLLFLFLLVLGGGNGRGGIGNIVLVEASSTGTPIPTLHVSLKGKTYELHDVTTLPELQERLEEVSGVSPKQQGRVLWNGQRLTTTTTSSSSSSSSSDGSDTPLALSEVGVKDGDQLNCVPATPGKKKTNKTSNTESGSGTTGSKVPASGKDVMKEEKEGVDGTSSSSSNPSIKDLLKGAGMDTSGLDEMMKMMGSGNGGGGNGAEAPSLQESMAMMTDMMKSPLFTQLMNDPEKLEESRQMILNNPMLKQMLAGLPGMEDLLNDPVAWRQAMQAAASLYQNMDPNDLMNAMMEGANASMMGGGMDGSTGMGMGLPPGLFNGMDTTTTTMSALDELSEGE